MIFSIPFIQFNTSTEDRRRKPSSSPKPGSSGSQELGSKFNEAIVSHCSMSGITTAETLLGEKDGTRHE